MAMPKFGLALAACLTLAGCAQSTQRTPVEAASEALNVAGVDSIEYSGPGEFFVLAQSPAPDAPWPRFTMPSYTAAVDYGSGSMRVELVREQAEDPPRGGGN
jgi:sarcosine oxidase gamma subunit